MRGHRQTWKCRDCLHLGINGREEFEDTKEVIRIHKSTIDSNHGIRSLQLGCNEYECSITFKSSATV